MKKLFFLVVFFSLAFLNVLSAQIVETEMRMSDGIQSALEVDLKGDAKQAEKSWKKFVKKIGKLDWDRKNKEHLLFNVVVTDIDKEYPVSIYSKFSSSKDITKGTFWIKMESDYLNSTDDAEELRAAGKWIQEYAYEVEREYIAKKLKDEEKTLGSLDKELLKLIKTNENLHKDIENAKEAITKAEKEIKENLKDQETKNKEVESQKEKLGAVKKNLGNVGKK
ncbi:MAG: hypothetical protein ACI9FN_001512 [Saprospiraceae bacterium]|jgi:hypothetical protein